MEASVFIDDWKLAVFEKHLKDAGYMYTKEPGVTEDTLLLRVQVSTPTELKPLVEAANIEARRRRFH